MDAQQLAAVAKYHNEVVACIEAHLQQALIDFAEDGAGPIEMRVLSLRSIQVVQAQANPETQTIELIRLLKQHDDGFRALQAALMYYGRELLAAALEEQNNYVDVTASTPVKLPKLWNAPLRQHRFVGREHFLQQLDELQNSSAAESKLTSGATTIFAACVGLGGIGKSSIALQFVYLNLKKYLYVFWVPSTTSNEIETYFAKLGDKLRLPVSINIQMWNETLSWLQVNPGWLIVFDDAPSYAIIQSYIPCTGGNILVTSRYTEWPCTTLTITPFVDEETGRYLELALQSRVAATEVSAFASILGNLPLAVAQAAAYVSKHKISTQEYITKFRAAERELLASKILPPDSGSQPVYFTWDVSVKQAKQECNFSVELLAFCSFLNDSYIPKALVDDFAKQRNSVKVLDEARSTLLSYSLISTAANSKRGLSMHPLVQVVTRANLKYTDYTDYVKYLCKCIGNIWPCDPELNHDTVRDIFPSIDKFLQYIRLEGETTAGSNLQLTVNVNLDTLFIAGQAYHILGYIPQEHDLFARMNKSAEVSNSHNADKTLIAIIWSNFKHAFRKKVNTIKGFSANDAIGDLQLARIWQNFGNTEGQLGNYKTQKKLLHKAALIYVKHYGPDHKEVATILNNLALAFSNLGEYLIQRNLLKKVLLIEEKHYGLDHIELATTLNNLALAYRNLDDHSKGKELLERALSISEKHYGPDHNHVAITLNNLGNVYGNFGDYSKQRNLLERALLIEEKHYGPDHKEVATTLNNLALAYGHLGDHSKQTELLERALSIYEKHYGPDHKEIATRLVNIANAYGYLGDHPKQKELLERARSIDDKHYGLDHKEVATILAHFQNAYDNVHVGSKQKELLERALSIHETHYNPDHKGDVTTLANLGNAYGHLGDYLTQKGLLERALFICRRYYDPDYIEVATILVHLGKAYGYLGDNSRKKELLERALSIYEKHYGPDHEDVATTLYNLALAYGYLHDGLRMKELLQRALLIHEKNYGPVHEEVAITLTCLGNAYSSLGDSSTGKELFERALSIYEKHYDPDHVNVAFILYNLGNAYGHLGDYSSVKELLRRALSTFEKHYGPDHKQVAAILVRLGTVYRHLRDYSSMKELFRRALSIYEKHYGPDHKVVGATLVCLGVAYDHLGAFLGMKGVLQRALSIYEEHYGTDHIVVATILVYLGIAFGERGNAYGRLDDYRRMKELLKRALPIYEQHYGPDHIKMVALLVRLGYAYGPLGDSSTMNVLLWRARRIKQKHYGPDHTVLTVRDSNVDGLIDISYNLHSYANFDTYLESMYHLFLASQTGVKGTYLIS